MNANKPSTRKIDFLKAIDSEFREDNSSEVSEMEPYFVTFPYPYMNGKLHLGHMFSLCKAEFMSRYQRLLGKNVLFPFAFHCTGMPISAAALKLKDELASESTCASPGSQFSILKQLGFLDVLPFTDPIHWIKTFPPMAVETLKKFGSNVDWRRSFVTTSYNPYYDSFVRWQFNKLKSLGYVVYGKRHSIFCPLTKQPCQDHDRLKGEGVLPCPISLAKILFSSRNPSLLNMSVRKKMICLRLTADENSLKIKMDLKGELIKISYENNGDIYYVDKVAFSNMSFQADNINMIGNAGPRELASAAEFVFNGKPLKFTILEDKSVAYAVMELTEGLKGELKAIEGPCEYSSKRPFAETDNFLKYFEPEDDVVSRAGASCVVALLDQWFIDYGNSEWKERAYDCLESMQVADSTRVALKDGVAWIGKWPCSRTFGLGTRIPWDEEYLIDSLSDSTIYMAFYTFKHILFSDYFGKDELFPSELLCDEVWDFIFGEIISERLFCGKGGSEGNLKKLVSEENFKKLLRCKEQLEYFYPVDLRVSGKDLVKNHLLFFIFNHVAMFKRRYWPKRIETNGHLLLNFEKMSKSTGNFLAGEDVLYKYGQNASRMCLASCGDSNDDANFLESVCNSYVLKLHTFIRNVEEAFGAEEEEINCLSSDLPSQFLLECVAKNVGETKKAYEMMIYRDVVKYGYHEMLNVYEKYLSIGGNQHSKLVRDMYRVMCIILYPIIPSVCSYLNFKYFKAELLWPEMKVKEMGTAYLISHVNKIAKSIIRASKRKKFTTVTIAVARDHEDWMKKCMERNYSSDELKEIFKKYNVPTERGMGFVSDRSKSYNVAALEISEYEGVSKLIPYIENLTKTNIKVVSEEKGTPFSPRLLFD